MPESLSVFSPCAGAGCQLPFGHGGKHRVGTAGAWFDGRDAERDRIHDAVMHLWGQKIAGKLYGLAEIYPEIIKVIGVAKHG